LTTRRTSGSEDLKPLEVVGGSLIPALCPCGNKPWHSTSKTRPNLDLHWSSGILDCTSKEVLMTIPRMSVITLGVTDLARSTTFYETMFGARPNSDYEGVSFFELPGTWLTLYPLDKLAEDISPQLAPTRGPFSGVTLAYNARSRDEVLAIFEEVKTAGASIVKVPQDTFWGGFSGYFADLDGYYWEVVWGPMFDFAPDGSLRFKQ